MVTRVQTAPPKPILVYDADCNFCRYWAKRWRQDAQQRGECVSLQEVKSQSRFPDVPPKEWEKAIHLVDID
ncbi:MAG: thiol-disulfide oxidoreductase DCC family protein, partial [Limisphaerales bacterium]